MKSGIMFSELGKYIKKDFFDKHKYFIIYTKDHNYKATIFSCYSIGIDEEENNIKLLDLDEEIEYYKKASIYSIDENIGEIKKIVKLSTCSYLNNHTTPTDQRYYIVAKIEIIEWNNKKAWYLKLFNTFSKKLFFSLLYFKKYDMLLKGG